MAREICVFGLWHLGCVTAACLAAQGTRVVGLDLDPDRLAALRAGRPPISEPGLEELIRDGVTAGRLRFSNRPAEALAEADILWVTFDTPVDDQDRADADWVRGQLEEVRPYVRAGTLVVVSSQVPVGFTAELEAAWRAEGPSVRVACIPENLRLGGAIEAFRNPERVVVGLGAGVERERIERLVAPFAPKVEWMRLESAEMTKHALNSFLAVSVAFANELARICERVGADAREVERGLRSDPRIGPRAYVSPGSPLAGGTLLRDVTFLGEIARERAVVAPLIGAVRPSNADHQAWARRRVEERVGSIPDPRVALLGLTYKAGTDTLRRSAALELAEALAERSVVVRGFDPAVRGPRPELGSVELATSLEEALDGADVAVATVNAPWLDDLTAETLVARMRRPSVVDHSGVLSRLAEDVRIDYARPGMPGRVRASDG